MTPDLLSYGCVQNLSFCLFCFLFFGASDSSSLFQFNILLFFSFILFCCSSVIDLLHFFVFGFFIFLVSFFVHLMILLPSWFTPLWPPSLVYLFWLVCFFFLSLLFFLFFFMICFPSGPPSPPPPPPPAHTWKKQREEQFFHFVCPLASLQNVLSKSLFMFFDGISLPKNVFNVYRIFCCLLFVVHFGCLLLEQPPSFGPSYPVPRFFGFVFLLVRFLFSICGCFIVCFSSFSVVFLLIACSSCFVRFFACGRSLGCLHRAGWGLSSFAFNDIRCAWAKARTGPRTAFSCKCVRWKGCISGFAEDEAKQRSGKGGGLACSNMISAMRSRMGC